MLAERVDGRYRGFGDVAAGLSVGVLGSQGYDVGRGDLPLPLLVLRESALAHNLGAMHGWCEKRGLALAPHGKTAMAPQLIRRQLDAGAWGMTAATVQQVAVMRAAGARRVILANQLVGRAEIGWLERERAADVEGFEGTVGSDREPATLAAVDAFLDRMRELVRALDARAAFAGVPEIIASAGGSALFDRVAARLRFSAPLSRPARVVLRSGCYLTHDDGLYARVSPLPELRPALELWARVLSCPELGLAIAGFGKRDAPYDIDLPVVREVRRAAAAPDRAGGLVVEGLNDQHAFIRDEHGALAVGDVLVCGISHPCTAFDKWSLIPVLDDANIVIGAVRTLF